LLSQSIINLKKTISSGNDASNFKLMLGQLVQKNLILMLIQKTCRPLGTPINSSVQKVAFTVYIARPTNL
jgi:hypothetical protein